MKTILVDAINGLINDDGSLFQEMYDLLEAYDNIKIVLTGANDEQFKKFNLHESPYDVFTLEHNPEKTEPEYYKRMLEYFKLAPDNVVYFEHNIDAVKSADSVGIKTYYYDHKKRDLTSLKKFLDENL
jgi:FMN phosphatase YigB (HAD superfamily)